MKKIILFGIVFVLLTASVNAASSPQSYGGVFTKPTGDGRYCPYDNNFCSGTCYHPANECCKNGQVVDVSQCSSSSSAPSPSPSPTPTRVAQTQTSPTSTSSSGNYLGCYNDVPTRALGSILSSRQVTLSQCLSLASNRGYSYIGMQHPQGDGNVNTAECWAGNGGYSRYGSTSCSKRDNSGNLMGDGWKNAVYRVSGSPPQVQQVAYTHDTKLQGKTVRVKEGETAKLSCNSNEVIKGVEAVFYCPNDARETNCNVNAINKQNVNFNFNRLSCGDPCQGVKKEGVLTISCGAAPPPPPPPPVIGDFNGDRCVNGVDYFELRGAYYGNNLKYDLNKDSTVNLDDYFVFADYYGTGDGCNGPVAPPCVSECNGASQRCTNNGVQICKDFNNDGCYEWGHNNKGDIENCKYGCNAGQCLSCEAQSNYNTNCVERTTYDGQCRKGVEYGTCLDMCGNVQSTSRRCEVLTECNAAPGCEKPVTGTRERNDIEESCIVQPVACGSNEKCLNNHCVQNSMVEQGRFSFIAQSLRFR